MTPQTLSDRNALHSAKPLSPWLRRVLGSRVLQALTAPHGVSRYLEAFEPAWSLDEDRAQVVAVRPEGEAAVTLTLRPTRGAVAFRAGQHVRLTVEVDGVRRTRCYSLVDAESADAREVAISVRAHSEGVVSRFLCERAVPGLVLGMSLPEGDFVLPSPRPERVLLISGGSGITPVMSMLRTLVREGAERPVTFLHYARSRADLMFGAELEQLAQTKPNLRVVLVFTRDSTEASSNGLTGHFSREHLQAVAPEFATSETFVCGPTVLVDSVRSLLTSEGSGARVHVEEFTPVSLPPSSSAVSGEVRFSTSAARAQNDGRTLLELAESAGLSPAHGCRRGICHSCTRRLCAGEVRHVRTGTLTHEPGADIQLCVNVPVGDVTVDL